MELKIKIFNEVDQKRDLIISDDYTENNFWMIEIEELVNEYTVRGEDLKKLCKAFLAVYKKDIDLSDENVIYDETNTKTE